MENGKQDLDPAKRIDAMYLLGCYGRAMLGVRVLLRLFIRGLKRVRQRVNIFPHAVSVQQTATRIPRMFSRKLQHTLQDRHVPLQSFSINLKLELRTCRGLHSRGLVHRLQCRRVRLGRWLRRRPGFIRLLPAPRVEVDFDGMQRLAVVHLREGIAAAVPIDVAFVVLVHFTVSKARFENLCDRALALFGSVSFELSLFFVLRGRLFRAFVSQRLPRDNSGAKKLRNV
mmetsp:Transcript_15616/g.40006  ORF Transcript_15616/g.40006 Transcript_15616/m.40006 type:complete len:228 (-) Transcript_15616:2326-3009(-)